MQQATTETKELPALLPGQLRCDRDPTQVAVYRYLWDWGETGVCCAEQGALLQQIGRQIERGVTLSPLENQPEQPLARTERVQLLAQIGTLEAELEEAKTRGLRLFNSNTEVTQRNRVLELRASELAAQVNDAKKLIDQLREDVAEAELQAGELLAENERLKTQLQFTAPRAELESHVVDGPTGPTP